MLNNIIRIMNFKFIRDKVKMCTLYKSMKILKVKDIYELEMAKFMYSFHNNFLPENFKNYFQTASNHHDHYTRSIAKNNFYLKRTNTRCGQQCFSYSGVKIWNKIQINLKHLNRFLFSKNIKESMIGNY